LSSQRQHVSTGSPFEPKVGISGVVRSGRIVAVSGTAPLSPNGKTVAKRERQVKREDIWKLFSPPLKDWAGKLSDVTRTRILLTRIEDWEEVAAVHGEFFQHHPPRQHHHADCALYRHGLAC
jgi:enamine deaminase RidA (YjgF/YER057c/UK114 family)